MEIFNYFFFELRLCTETVVCWVYETPFNELVQQEYIFWWTVAGISACGSLAEELLIAE